MYWKRIFLLLLLPLASCVRYASYLAELEPPARYNHPYSGTVVEHVMPLAEVRDICGYDATACAGVFLGTCYMVLPSDGQAPVSVYRRHETAHCNGWAAHHPRDG